MRFYILLLCAVTFLAAAHPVQAQDALPEAVKAQTKGGMVPMGSSVYKKFGFSVYRITFWTADGTWDRKKPYALEMRYMRDISKDTLVDTFVDDLREQNLADDMINNWHKVLDEKMSDIKEGDTIVSLYLPDQQKAPMFRNNDVLMQVKDKAFIDAFFDIWLGPNADEDMREKLLTKI